MQDLPILGQRPIVPDTMPPGEIATLSLAPGDILVFRSPLVLHPSLQQQILNGLSAMLKRNGLNNSVALLDQGSDLLIVRPTPDDANDANDTTGGGVESLTNPY